MVITSNSISTLKTTPDRPKFKKTLECIKMKIRVIEPEKGPVIEIIKAEPMKKKGALVAAEAV